MEPINDNTRKWLSWAIVVMLIVISTVMGVQLPIPQPPIEGDQQVTLGYTHFSGLVVTEPTTVATATPGAVINSLGLGNILEIQDASTPVWTINNGGAVVGASGETNNSWLKVAGPTAIATATPAAVVDSLGKSNILEIRDAATPVAKWTAAGNLVLGRILQLDCTYVEEAANTNENLTPASTCYQVAVASSKNADYTLTATGMVTGTLLAIQQIGAGTLVITDTILLSHDGNALSLGQYDQALLMFDGTNWDQLIEVAAQ